MPPLTHHLTCKGQDRTLHLKSAGAGRDIVLIHGALTTHADWMGDLFDRFSERGRAFAVDRPGHGESRRPRFDAAPLAQARQIREGLRTLGVERPLLVGHSFGARVALGWASAYPDEIAGLVLAAPIVFQEFRLVEHPLFGPRALPIVGPILAQVGLAAVDRDILPYLQRLMFAPDAPPPDWLARYPRAKVLTVAATTAEGEDAVVLTPGAWPGRIDYQAITAPTRLLAGRRDQVVDPARHAEGLARLLPEARLTLRPAAGHMVHHTDSAALFEIVDDLLGLDAAEPSRRMSPTS